MGNNFSEWSKQALISELKKLKKQKKFGLLWEDSPEKVAETCKENLPVLKDEKNKEIIKDKEGLVNVFIEGDNYHALSVLNYTHQGKIDVIYIDPPYNTGAKTWKYNNDYVDREDVFRHSKWISFMYKRLVLAKKLLAKNGFFICSIDSNELFSLGLLLNEIFGENNKIGLITVEHNPKGRNLSKFFSENSEFMLIYAKNISLANFNDITIDEEKQATFNLNDKEGKYRLEPFMRVRTSWSKKNKPKNYYPIYISKNLEEITLEKKEGYYEIFPKTKDGREWAWKNVSESFAELNKNGHFVAVQEDGEIKIMHKYREKQVFKNVWTNKKYHSEFHGTNLLKEMLGKNIFEYPKSLYLILDILKITTKKDSTILDFFAGSGTTAHAVLKLNNEDGGNRRFIVCTNNENNIASEVCYPRIKKAINMFDTENKSKLFTKSKIGNLKYFTTNFVKAAPTDKNKRELVNRCTEMLCLKEGAFELFKKGENFAIFKDSKKYLGIIYDEDAIEEFKKEAKKIDSFFVVYVFSLDQYTHEDRFKDIQNKVELNPIPEAILSVYRRIFK